MEIKMSPVKACSVDNCAYNGQHACHALAITIGEPGGDAACDTFFEAARHGGVREATAGVGACKSADCKFNQDYECSAMNIQVGMQHNQPDCLTYQVR